jgi:hypothetical protein
VTPVFEGNSSDSDKMFEQIATVLDGMQSITINMTAVHAFALVRLVQMALIRRDVNTQDPVQVVGRQMANELIQVLGSASSEVGQALDQGWSPEFEGALDGVHALSVDRGRIENPQLSDIVESAVILQVAAFQQGQPILIANGIEPEGSSGDEGQAALSFGISDRAAVVAQIMQAIEQALSDLGLPMGDPDILNAPDWMQPGGGD